MKKVLLFAASSILLSQIPASAFTVATWNFDGTAPATLSTGSGAASGTVQATDDFAGSTAGGAVNFTSDAGTSVLVTGSPFALQFGRGTAGAFGGTFTLNINFATYSAGILKFAVTTAGGSTVLPAISVTTSSGAGSPSSFTPPITGNTDTDTYTLPVAANNNSSLTVTFSFSGASNGSIGYAFDNITIDAIPEPATAAGAMFLGLLAIGKSRSVFRSRRQVVA